MYIRSLPWLLPVLAPITCFYAAPLHADESAQPKTYEVRAIRDVAYYEGDDADKVRHKLDIFVPKDLKQFPVVLFIHGGAWMTGDKGQFGLYSTFGVTLAKKGIGVVVANYRLSPKVMHPEHIKDVARAFAWTHQNIEKYGGDPAKMFVCGHSAGGHLVALLASDESYLKEHKLDLKAIKGAIPVSGVLEIADDMMPKVFGSDKEICKKASPISHVCAALPPFLVIYADSDFPVCAKTSMDFCKVLEDKKCHFEKLEVKKRNHISIMLNANVEGDPVTEALLKFIDKNKGS